jgi:endonuclease YncB( thermonuclease family)
MTWLALLLVYAFEGTALASEGGFEAVVTECYDGDTCSVIIDLGFGLTLNETIRLARINAWEVTGPERKRGMKAKQWLNDRIAKKTVQLQLHSRLREKYGRILADVIEDRVNINDAMVEHGHATYQEY